MINNKATSSETYTLSLHDALPCPVLDPPDGSPETRRQRQTEALLGVGLELGSEAAPNVGGGFGSKLQAYPEESRSEEHTSELQSQSNLGCSLLLEKNSI